MQGKREGERRIEKEKEGLRRREKENEGETENEGATRDETGREEELLMKNEEGDTTAAALREAQI